MTKFKMKNMAYWKAKNVLPGINGKSDENMPDGRSKSSPYQKGLLSSIGSYFGIGGKKDEDEGSGNNGDNGNGDNGNGDNGNGDNGDEKKLDVKGIVKDVAVDAAKNLAVSALGHKEKSDQEKLAAARTGAESIQNMPAVGVRT